MVHRQRSLNNTGRANLMYGIYRSENAEREIRALEEINRRLRIEYAPGSLLCFVIFTYNTFRLEAAWAYVEMVISAAGRGRVYRN